MYISNQINGPINVVRMEGKIGNIKKVVYLFMDRHDDYNVQTKCNNPGSIDVQEYFKSSFRDLDRSNKTYDFFMEIFPSTAATMPLEISNIDFSKENYLTNMWKFFYDNLKFDPKINKVDSLFKNVRLHYIDIRDIFYYFTLKPLDFATIWLEDLRDKPGIAFEIKDIIADVVKTTIEIIIDFLNLVKNILTKSNSLETNKIVLVNKLEPDILSFILDKEIQYEYLKRIAYIINKFTNGYKNDHSKIIMNDYIENFLLVETKNNLQKILDFYNEIKSLEPQDYFNNNNPNKKLINNLIYDIEYLRKNLQYYLAYFVDLYFLRRFLDKDYITNAIIYTGAAHSVFYIWVLSKNNSEITHCAKCNIEPSSITQIIKEMPKYPTKKNIKNIFPYFMLNETTIQCSDVSGFPKNFD